MVYNRMVSSAFYYFLVCKLYYILTTHHPFTCHFYICWQGLFTIFAWTVLCRYLKIIIICYCMWNFCPPVILQMGLLAGKSAPLHALSQSSNAWRTWLNFIFFFMVSLVCSAGKIALFSCKVEAVVEKLHLFHTITFFHHIQTLWAFAWVDSLIQMHLAHWRAKSWWFMWPMHRLALQFVSIRLAGRGNVQTD